MGEFTFEFSDGMQIKIDEKLVTGYSDRFVGRSELADRIARLFWVEAIALVERYGINALEIVQPIFDLENGTNISRTKPAAPFRNPPLRGLWHKHFTSARFLAHNITAEFGKNGLERLVREVLEPRLGQKLREEDVSTLAHRVVHDPLNARSADGRTTGEWIIYLPYHGKNYYLSCTHHKHGDQAIYDQIIGMATLDFPALLDWLDEAKNQG